MAFVDEVSINLISGAGGNGCISFRREKYIPKGGPDGGNGGRGGSIWIRATRDKQSLLDFKYKPKFEAERGQHGMGSDCDGRRGEDLVLEVPMGTLVYDAESGELVADLSKDGQTKLVAPGGRGGRGNRTFTSSTRRAPRISTPGHEGQTRTLKLELQLMADVGLLGLPNAGKSSFLTRVSRARPKIADYPFTTLEPGLGVVEHKDLVYVVADLPGLIEGASEGAGLGHKFLRHVSRNRVLLHLVDLSQTDDEIVAAVKTIRKELKAFDTELAEREEILVFSKADLLLPEEVAARVKTLAKRKLKGTAISSHTGLGIEALLDRVGDVIRRARKEALDAELAVTNHVEENTTQASV